MKNLTMTTRHWRAATTLGALFTAVGSGAFAAQPAPVSVPSVKVTYGDLNVGTAQGTSALYARITYAAHQVCGGGNLDIRDLGASMRERDCERDAITRAVQKVDSPQLAALYAARQRHG